MSGEQRVEVEGRNLMNPPDDVAWHVRPEREGCRCHRRIVDREHKPLGWEIEDRHVGGMRRRDVDELHDFVAQPDRTARAKAALDLGHVTVKLVRRHNAVAVPVVRQGEISRRTRGQFDELELAIVIAIEVAEGGRYRSPRPAQFFVEFFVADDDRCGLEDPCCFRAIEVVVAMKHVPDREIRKPGCELLLQPDRGGPAERVAEDDSVGRHEEQPRTPYRRRFKAVGAPVRKHGTLTCPVQRQPAQRQTAVAPCSPRSLSDASLHDCVPGPSLRGITSIAVLETRKTATSSRRR